jgi:hypothetical protein
VVGEWRLTELKVNDADFELEKTFEYAGQEIEQSLRADMEVTPDLTASFESRLLQTTADSVAGGDAEEEVVVPYTYTYTYAWEGEAEIVHADEFDIELTALDDAREDLELTCTFEDDELDCDGDNGDDEVEMVFVARKQGG